MRGKFDSDLAASVFTEDREGARERTLRYLDRMRTRLGDQVLLSTELDVLPDGRPVFPEDLLPHLDLIVGAVHALAACRHGESEDAIRREWQAQNRALIAVGAHIIAHPFRYLIQRRFPVTEDDVHWIVAEARASGVALELNSHYVIRNLDDLMIRACLAEGVPIAIGTDAHRWTEIADFTYHAEVLSDHGLRTQEERADRLYVAQVARRIEGAPGAGNRRDERSRTHVANATSRP
ncbi:MAG: hypothetical protein GX785_16245 [Armatimonadetes bacterium]|nr:hypothetical protein [Armatimonadota bacterium]